MKYLLDTHILLWTLANTESELSKLTPKTMRILADSQSPKYFSAVNIWEIAVKFSQRRTDFQISPDQILRSSRDIGFVELQIT